MQREEDFWCAKYQVFFGLRRGRKLKNLGLNLCSYNGFTDAEEEVLKYVIVALPGGDPVQEFIQLKYAFDFALMSIEEILRGDNLHYDYAKILEDLHKHEKNVRELLEYRIIRNNHAANEYYLKIQELCRVAAGRIEDLTVASLS